jgi:alkylation response protein AidB-like acyl-CoA dehydrogenase
MTSVLAPAAGFSRRALYGDEHEDLRQSVRRFLEREVVPHGETWDAAGIVPRDIYVRAGELGFVGTQVPEEFGGAGVDDFRFNAVLGEEIHRAQATAFGMGLCNHNDVCVPYLTEYAVGEQRERWLPGVASGERITAIAMTEPGTGSDLAGIATRGVRADGGWVVNGSKTFITCGHNADIIITAIRTDPAQRHRGLTMMVIEGDMDGFQRGRRLDKMGQHGVDTAELFFQDLFVPDANVLGEPGQGFLYMVSNLPQERMSIAVAAQSEARAALAETITYVTERRAFGQPVASFQATRHALAEMCAEVEVGQAYVDRCITELVEGNLTPEAAAIAKLWTTEMQGRVVDRCLQLHGGYGYTNEYAIARRYTDARVTRIYGGTSEIMKEIIGKSLTRP